MLEDEIDISSLMIGLSLFIFDQDCHKHYWFCSLPQSSLMGTCFLLKCFLISPQPLCEDWVKGERKNYSVSLLYQEIFFLLIKDTTNKQTYFGSAETHIKFFSFYFSCRRALDCLIYRILFFNLLIISLNS